MKGKVFRFGEDEDRLIPMEETPYDQEAVLQRWLSDYPELLPGDQIDPENPRRWLLVKAEMGIPDREDGSSRWSLDHLFLDQDGRPTFVECKRSSDTRARREVVAQMLDYAANGIEYWSIDRIRQAAAETSGEQSLDERVAELIDSNDDEKVENFWKTVETNLREGKVRLLFVADETTKELRRLVEFLNEKLLDVEVLAVEVKQYAGSGQTAVVPRVIGVTEATRKTKQLPKPRRETPWTEEELIEKVKDDGRPDDGVVIRKILDWARDNELIIQGGRGPISASMDLILDKADKKVRAFTFFETAKSTKFHVYFSGIEAVTSVSEKREELIARLDAIGFAVRSDSKLPSIECGLLKESDRWEQFLKTLDWIMDHVTNE